MNLYSLDIVDQAVTNFFIGFGLALVNILLDHFVRPVPRVITVLSWQHTRRAILLAYLIALVLQLATSPFFRSLLHSVYRELAWSPYQAVFNVLGVMAMDLIVGTVRNVRRGAAAGRAGVEAIASKASAELGELGTRVPLTPEARAEAEARRQAEAEAEAQARDQRKQRLQDRLDDH